MKVLVADDDPVPRRIVEASLRQAGYTPVLAVDGMEVLRILAEPDPPRLIVLDWLMPRLDGLGVLIVDLDHFKAINDTHGHVVGDDVLREVARRMRMSVRTYDAIGRYGGEEFLVVAPGCGVEAARELAERLRACVAHSEIA